MGRHLPALIAEASLRPADGLGSLAFPGGRLLFSRRQAAPARTAANDPLTLLLASVAQERRLKHELKDQQFQVNYRVVELEALYDVGLAVAATLDLDRVSEEILLRAVSLLDARRGALYILEDGRYRLDRTFGGEAAPLVRGRGAGARRRSWPAPRAPAEPPPGRPLSPRRPDRVRERPARPARGRRQGEPPRRRPLPRPATAAPSPCSPTRRRSPSKTPGSTCRPWRRSAWSARCTLAAEIQRQILPKGAPPVPGLRADRLEPPGARRWEATTTTSSRRADGRVGLVVGDVTGKGMPAALMVSTLHSALRLLLDQIGFGPAMLERLSRHICESSAANKFITMLMAELNPETGVPPLHERRPQSGLSCCAATAAERRGADAGRRAARPHPGQRATSRAR